MDGGAAVGTTTKYAREDHRHPTDTSKADLTQVVRYDAAQSLTAAQQVQARANVYAAPFDAMATNGMQFNGSMDVSQENGATAVNFPSGTQSKYVIDGWLGLKTGGTATFGMIQTSSIFSGYAKQLSLYMVTAQASMGSDVIDIRHRIEGWRIARLAWGTATAQPLTVGFWLKSSIAGTLPLICVNSAGTVAPIVNVTITAPGVQQFVTATFPAQTTGTWLVDNGLGIDFILRVASSGGFNIASVSTNTFEMTGLVVLPGIEAPTAARSALIMRPYDQELATCQRYLDVGQIMMQSPAIGSMIQTRPWSVPMRAAPTVTMTVLDAGTGGSITANLVAVDMGAFQMTSPMVNGYARWSYKADARL
jgi:hypothetical protein